MSEKLGPWHKLEVMWLRPMNETWTEIKRGPLPEGTDPLEVDYDYEWTHPEECGDGCFNCGTHQPCAIDYDLSQGGLYGLTGQDQLAPGLYAARHGLEVSRGYYETEIHSWLDFELTTEDDPRFASLTR